MHERVVDCVYHYFSQETLEALGSSVSEQAKKPTDTNKDTGSRSHQSSLKETPANFANQKRSAENENIDPGEMTEENSSNDELASPTVSGCTPFVEKTKSNVKLFKGAAGNAGSYLI